MICIVCVIPRNVRSSCALHPLPACIKVDIHGKHNRYLLRHLMQCVHTTHTMLIYTFTQQTYYEINPTWLKGAKSTWQCWRRHGVMCVRVSYMSQHACCWRQHTRLLQQRARWLQQHARWLLYYNIWNTWMLLRDNNCCRVNYSVKYYIIISIIARGVYRQPPSTTWRNKHTSCRTMHQRERMYAM